MNVKMKRCLMSAVAVCLVCVLLAGSALAFHVTYQEVSMPDPYGVSVLNLSEDTTNRTIFNSSPIVYGAYTSSYRKTYSSQSKTFDGSGYNHLLASYSPGTASARGMYLSVPSGTYIDWSANVSYSNTEYGSFLVTGGGTFYLFLDSIYAVLDDVSAYPNTVQVLVNGSPVGDKITVSSSGVFTIPDLEVDLSGAVTSVGLRFTWTSADTVSGSTSYGYSDAYRRLYAYMNDNVNLTPIAKEDTDYVPYFERVIAWLQSIFSAVNPLHNDLLQIAEGLSSLTGEQGIQAVVQALTGTNGTVANFTEDLKTIFASDEDLQLKEDTAPVISTVTDTFFSGADESTSITTEKVTTAGETLKGMTSMFDSGYDATDAFTDIAENTDDYLAWFTTDVAGWLNTVPSSAAEDGDEDPYNMWRVQEQYDAISKARGD